MQVRVLHARAWVGAAAALRVGFMETLVSFHRLVMSAALTVGLACAGPIAAAREPVRIPVAPVAPVAVDGVDVEQVVALGAGVPLNFTVFGTPGASVALRIEGGRRVLELNEAEPGVYEGSYLIDGVDAIRPESRVTATLRKNGAVAYAALDEPLLLAQGAVPWGVAATPPAPGVPVAPGPMSSPAPVPAAALDTAPTFVPSPSIAPPAGAPVPPSAAPTTTVPIVVATPQPVPPAAVAAPPTPAEPWRCADCAVVESIRPVEAPPRGGVIGAIGGAIAGAILGKEAGEAHNRRVLAVLGAIGGAFAGRQIERQATRATHYDVDLRLADGSVLKRRYEQPPPFAAGATIRLGTPPRSAPVPTF